jgi:thiol-disulfide isomerase/thioredoxin
VDDYQRPTASSHIRWVRLENSKEVGTPADVEVNGEGYFFIPGLRPGSQYKLIARSKQGDKVLANIAYAQAPSINLYIQVKEDFAAGIIPADGERTKTSADNRTQPATAYNTPPPGANVSAVNSTVPDLPPMTVPVPTSQAPARTNVTPPTWAPSGVATNPAPTWPPALNIANPNNRPPAPPPNPPRPPALNPADAKLSYSTPRVPSCVLLGKHLENLALRDTSGGVWEFRTSKRGKLILIDFWATWCPHCLPVMPELNRLQMQYGGQGLEVVGVALEQEGTVDKQAVRVNEFCRARQVSYRQLLGEPTVSNIGAASQFNLASIPKVVLLDEDGWILWEHVGAPDRATLDELERILQGRLSRRPS